MAITAPQIASAAVEPLPEHDPVIWVIGSYRAGENSQLLGLARRLGRPYTLFRPNFNWFASLLGLARVSSSAGVANLLQLPPGPWPDLVISSGLKNEPFIRWIRACSGGRTRLIFLGRSWMRQCGLDLLITTPQYRIPASANVLQNQVTMHDISPASLDAVRASSRESVGALPRPLTAVLIGGSSGPHYFGPRTARRLRHALQALHERVGGTLYLTTSARTPPAAVAAIRQDLAADAIFYEWQPNDAGNPYMALLAQADQIVVTSDSVAMMSEAAATGSAVLIFAIDDAADHEVNLKARIYRWMMRFGPPRFSRDLSLFHRAYIEAGYGRWLGVEAPATTPINRECEHTRTVNAVRQLAGLPALESIRDEIAKAL